jgi:ABC-type glycerol-3-phosphate transport system substrate-binding protein
VTYQTYGRYATNGGLIGLDDRLPNGYGAEFAPSFWQAVKTQRGVFGLPQHTDTFATYNHKDVLRKAGVTAPTALAKAWTWDEFCDAARRVKAATGQYAFAYGFSPAGGPSSDAGMAYQPPPPGPRLRTPPHHLRSHDPLGGQMPDDPPPRPRRLRHPPRTTTSDLIGTSQTPI